MLQYCLSDTSKELLFGRSVKILVSCKAGMWREAVRTVDPKVCHCLHAARGRPAAESASLAGMVSKALDIMEAWVKACPKQGLKGLSAEKPLQPVPRWMDALLLLVNSCTAIIWKEATPAAPADKPTATEPQVRPDRLPDYQRGRAGRALTTGLHTLS